MNTDITQYCLVALLSLDAEQQAAEAEALLNAPLAETQLAACLRSQGQDPERALEQWVGTVLDNQSEASEVGTMGKVEASEADSEINTRGTGNGQNVNW